MTNHEAWPHKFFFHCCHTSPLQAFCYFQQVMLKWKILCLLKLLYITSELHIITMAVIVNLQTWFCKQNSGMIMIYFCTRLPTPGATVSLVTVIKPKAKGGLYMITMLLFLLLYKYFLKKLVFFSKNWYHILFQYHKVKVLVSIPSQEFAHLPCCYYGSYEICKYSVMASSSGKMWWANRPTSFLGMGVV